MLCCRKRARAHLIDFQHDDRCAARVFALRTAWRPYVLEEFLYVLYLTAYQTWQAPSDPTFMDVYVFNLTNAADVLAGVAAPNLAEVGPLRYQEVTTRINVSWSSDGSTLK